MTVLRRLDHVAVLVRSTEAALRFYEQRLGLSVHSSEVIEKPHVRLTYLEAGNVYLQLLEPLDEASPLALWLEENGEGLHHICFAVDDVVTAVTDLSDPGVLVEIGNGRGREAAFVNANDSHGVVIECTTFDREADVDAITGYRTG